MYEKNEEQDKQLSGISPYIQCVEDTLVDDLVLSLQGQTNQEQLQSIQNFTVQQHKFFSASQILKILLVLQSNSEINPNLVRNHAIIAMKPYISPLSTIQAQQIISIIPWADGVGPGIIMSQIYDQDSNIQNKETFNSTISGYYRKLNSYQSSQQFLKYYRNNFLITTEGLINVAFIIDQSSTMGSVAYKKEDGSIIKRYDLLRQFYSDTRLDIFQKFKTFSYSFMGGINKNEICLFCSTDSYVCLKAMSALVYNNIFYDGDSNIYKSLEYYLSNPSNQITDLYLWSDGITTEGTIYINDFIKLVEETNYRRGTKIRINTVSFLVGGDEPLIVKQNSNNLLQTLADITGGTFIQVSQLYN
ncbi:hypothetical protein ABPG74_012305 [Tetrahymena malaccensis]